jgi:hypothetical protein
MREPFSEPVTSVAPHGKRQRARQRPLSLVSRIGHAARVRLAMTDTTAPCGLERRELWTKHAISTAEASEGQVGA